MQDTFFRRILNRFFFSILNSLRRFRIYNRLIVSFLLIIIIPNLIISYYSFNISSHEMDKIISSSTKRILSNIEQTIGERLRFYEKIAHSIYSDPEIIDLLIKCKSYSESKIKDQLLLEEYEECKKRIGNILNHMSPTQDINNLQIVSDYDQFVQIDSGGVKRGASVKDIESYTKSDNYIRALEADGSPIWVDTSREEGVYLVQPSETSYLGGYITLFRAIPDPAIGRNKYLGVIVINVPCRIFKDLVNLKNMYDENEVILLAGKTGIISIMNGVYRVNKNPDLIVLNEMYQQKEGSLIRKVSGTDNILVFRTFEKADMIIAYMTERNKILKGIYNVRNITVKVTLMCILCALILSYIVTKSISVPLNRLKKTIESVGESNLELEYVDDQKDEIGALGMRFNIMISRIKNLLDKLVESEVSRKSEEIRRKEAELNALQMQIKPHFMYNTLDLIRWNAIFAENGESTVSKMIAEFSNLLRFNTLRSNQLVKVNEEFEHLNAYVKVLKFKKELKFNVKIDLESDKILDYKITKLTFQPIIENTIKHGFIDMNKEGEIKINAYTSNEDLFIEIRDNGVGICKDRLESLNDELQNGKATGGSMGLRNVNERIKLHFGEKYGLNILSEERKFTSVIVHIPCVSD
ncbi:MAG TPA: histidine kinase [Clostridiaceae bacterium]|nr:histidine kinase [Clostridiaceae bacterium]